jgi:NitT/TauT family transport system ATP-binding protein
MVRAGFIPLIDAAPLIVAARAGFAEAEGVDLELVRETTWASLRDRIAVRHLDVAHMLAPMPIAANLGLTQLSTRLIAPMALGFGGNTITVSRALWHDLERQGATADFDARRSADAFAAVVRARKAEGRARLCLAVVHPHSAHRYQVAYWLAAAGVDPDRDVEFVVVPPPLTADALAGGQIDAFSAGEPWGSVAVAANAGCILTTNASIWRSSPEKVLGVRAAWAEEDGDRLGALVRAVYRASVWCDEPGNRSALADMLAATDLLAMPAGIIRGSLERRLVTAGGEQRAVDGFLSFAARSGTFPWISHALWFFSQMVRWGDAEMSDAALDMARSAYRPDLYRAALQPLGVPLPIASSKVEGMLAGETLVASTTGQLAIGPDTFFDGAVFDPDHVAPPPAGRN